jgi:putative membrane protein
MKLISLKTISIISTLAVAGAVQAQNQFTSTNSNSRSTSTATSTQGKDAILIQQIAHDNAKEIALAEIGVRKATNPELKQFCQQMQQDHTQANQQLRPLAQKNGVTLEQSMERKDEKALTKFQSLSDQKFDKALAEEFLTDHQKGLTHMQSAASQAQSSDLKQFAQQMLPKLQEHFTHAQTVAKAAGVSDSTISSIAKKSTTSAGAAGDSTSSSSSGSGSKKN